MQYKHGGCVGGRAVAATGELLNELRGGQRAAHLWDAGAAGLLGRGIGGRLPLGHRLRHLPTVPLSHAAVRLPGDNLIRAGLGGKIHCELGTLGFRDGLHHAHPRGGIGRGVDGFDRAFQGVLARSSGDGEGEAGTSAVDKLEALALPHALDRHGMAGLRAGKTQGLAGPRGGKIRVDEDGQRH